MAAKDEKTFLTQRAKVGFRDGNAAEAKGDHVAFEDAQASQTSQSTLLLQKKKLMEDAQIELDRKKEEIRLRMLRCQEKEDELAETQAALRLQVVKFEKFLKDNDAKRLRSHRKALDEIKQREAYEKDIEAQANELAELHARKRERAELLDRVMVYQQYLEEVKDYSDDYHDITQVLDRYNTLDNANADLHAGISNFIAQMDKQRGDLATFIKEAQNQILVSNSKIAEHQEQLEFAKMESAKLERERAGRENRHKEETRMSGEVRLTQNNLRALHGTTAGAVSPASSSAVSCIQCFL